MILQHRVIYKYIKPLSDYGEKYMKQITVLLPEKTILQAKEIAALEQMPYTVMFRHWIAQRIREYAPVPPSKAETSAATP
jgi:hypothetical protein